VEKSIKKQTRPEQGRGISRLAYGSLEMTVLNVFYKALTNNNTSNGVKYPEFARVLKPRVNFLTEFTYLFRKQAAISSHQPTASAT
jgi:hypothetical protein